MNNQRKKLSIGLASLVLVLVCAVGGTLAWMAAASNSVTNTFVPASISTTVEEKTEGGVKRDVQIQNTGDVDAYIRAAVVINLLDDKGNIVGTAPAEETDYTITWGQDWFQLGDYYYYPSKVAPTGRTTDLIKECQPMEGKNLQVTILAEGVQADGKDENNIPAVNLAWGNGIVVQADGTLAKAN